MYLHEFARGVVGALKDYELRIQDYEFSKIVFSNSKFIILNPQLKN
jgi:hypothetical protein